MYFAWFRKKCAPDGCTCLRRSVIIPLFAFKLAYLLSIIALVSIFPSGRRSEMANYSRIQWSSDGHPTLQSYFTTWDVGHYIYLIQNGYKPGDKSCAFFPLWPLVIRYCSLLTAGHYVIVGVLLANLFSLAGFAILFQILFERLGPRAARTSLILLIVFPGSLFFQFPYSESLFFLLVMTLCLALLRERLWLAFIAAYLLPLTRAPGVFCVYPIALHVLCRLKRGSFQKDKRQSVTSNITCGSLSLSALRATGAGKAYEDRSTAQNMVLLTAPLFGWITYLLLMWFWTGNPLEGYEAQRYWGVQSIDNLFHPQKFLVGLLTANRFHEFSDSLLDRGAFILLLLCLPLIWRLDKEWFLWALFLGIVPAVTGTFTSFIRFASVLFPVFAALGFWCESSAKPAVFRLLLASFLALHSFLLWRFVHFGWAG